jgi:hypothetical protein
VPDELTPGRAGKATRARVSGTRKERPSASDAKTLEESCLGALRRATDEARNFRFKLTLGNISFKMFPDASDGWLYSCCDAVEEFGAKLFRLGYGRRAVAAAIEKSWPSFMLEFRRLVAIVGYILQIAGEFADRILPENEHLKPEEIQKSIDAAESRFLKEFSGAKVRAKLPIHFRQRPKHEERTVGELRRASDRHDSPGTRTGKTTAIRTGRTHGFLHAEDFSWIEWEGERIDMTVNGAQIIATLARDGGPKFTLSHASIRSKLRPLKPDSIRLRDSLKRSKVWNTLVVSDRKARTLRLTCPPA